ncbi:hypothetical protein [uncultured Anaerotruncus sp.]|uniref:hypothetical protein n=1 Tax=uncultured Anaerotruncus sp. TaxID=905011 RepID=UPI00280B889F|nr:hypothetical protein [uncultured Anaerotruncus sp.]
MQNSGDLYDLIAQDGRAHQFFAALPDGVRDAVSWQAKSLHSFPELRACAQELLSDYD